MSTVDIIILICFILALAEGFTKGFISQLSALISLILGAWLSFRFAGTVCEWLKPYLEVPEQVLYIISFGLILTVVLLGMFMISRLILSLVKLVMLGWLDKLLGVFFALLKAALLIGILIILFNTINTKMNLVREEVLQESKLYGPLKDLAYTIFPYLKELLMKQ